MAAVLAQYELLEEIGHGGMGRVYKARDRKLGRLVALKLLREELFQDSGYRTRFEREARAASRLNHPNVATIYEFGERDGQNFIAMEYVAGKGLNRLLSERTPTLEEVYDWSEQLGSALDSAHRLGIVHRDLKPSNVVVTAEGTAKLVDFGLAKFGTESEADLLSSEADTDPMLTAVDTGLGTLPYVAPEQLLSARESDHRADIFSLGVMTYEMLTGRRPFMGESRYELAQSVLNRPPTPIESLGLDVPRSVSSVIYKALAKNPQERYASVTEFISGLRTARSETAYRVPRPASLGSLAPCWASRLGTWLRRPAAVLILGAALAGAGLGGWLSSRAPQQTRAPTLAFFDVEDRTGSQEHSSWALSLRELVAAGLMQSASIRVVAPASAAHLAPGQDEPAAQARAAGGDYAVLSVLRREGAVALLTMKLIDAGSGELFWSAGVRGNGLFGLADATVDSLARALVPKSSPRPQTRHYLSENERAVERYVAGRAAYDSFDPMYGTEAFQDAIAIDPEFVAAWYWLYRAHVSRTDRYDDPNARAALARASELSSQAGPELREAIRIAKLEGEGRWDEWERALRARAAAYPMSADAQYELGRVLWYRDNVEEAEVVFERLTALEPARFRPRVFRLGLLASQGRRQEVLVGLREALHIFPRSRAWHAQVLPLALVLQDAAMASAAVACLQQEGGVSLQADGAVGCVQGPVRWDATWWYPGLAGDAAVLEGRIQEAEHVYRQLEHLEPRETQLRNPPFMLHGRLAALGLQFPDRAELRPGARRYFEEQTRVLRSRSQAGYQVSGFDADYFYQLALLQLADGDLEAAAEAIGHLASRAASTYMRQDDYLASAAEALMASAEGRHREAVRNARLVHDWEGVHDFWCYHYAPNLLARVLVRAGREREAVAATREVIARFPGAALYRLELARLYQGLGETGPARDEARAFLELWRKADPDRPELAEAKAMLQP